MNTHIVYTEWVELINKTAHCNDKGLLGDFIACFPNKPSNCPSSMLPYVCDGNKHNSTIHMPQLLLLFILFQHHIIYIYAPLVLYNDTTPKILQAPHTYTLATHAPHVTINLLSLSVVEYAQNDGNYDENDEQNDQYDRNNNGGCIDATAASSP